MVSRALAVLTTAAGLQIANEGRRISIVGDERCQIGTAAGRWLPLAVAVVVAAILVGSAPGVAHASVCPAGNFCSATFGDVTYTVIGPCDTSTVSSVIAGCFVVGTGPSPGGS